MSSSIICQPTTGTLSFQRHRPPRRLPRMVLNPAVDDLFAFGYEDFTLADYDPHPHIKAKVAV